MAENDDVEANKLDPSESVDNPPKHIHIDFPESSENQGERTLDQEVGEIIENHKVIAEAAMELRRIVSEEVAKAGEQLDPAGWRMYVFDANLVSGEEVTDLNSNIDVNPELEINVKPVEEVDRTRRYYFDENGLKREIRVAQERLPESMDILSKDGTKVRIDILPIGVSEPEWTIMHAEVPGGRNVTNEGWPEVVSNSQNNEVVVNFVRPQDVEDSIVSVSANISSLSEIAQKIKEGKYHYRIFGNTNSSESPQKPKFIISDKRKDSSQLPKET